MQTSTNQLLLNSSDKRLSNTIDSIDNTLIIEVLEALGLGYASYLIKSLRGETDAKTVWNIIQYEEDLEAYLLECN